MKKYVRDYKYTHSEKSHLMAERLEFKGRKQMDKKVVFLDVDGTLINEKGEIPKTAQDAIRRAIKNGHKMVVCSGRSLFQMQKNLLELGFSGIIGSAGAFVIVDGQEIYHAYIEEAQRKKAAEFLEKNNIIYYFQIDNGSVISAENKKRVYEYGAEKLNVNLDYLEPLLGTFYVQEQVWDNEKEEKIIYFDSMLSVEELNQELQPYFEAVVMSMPGANASCGEIGIAGINKATAMKIYLEHVGVSRENCIAVGDGPNDLQMMEYAGVSVAMGNALESVKERADFVTTHIDDDGIVKAFEKLGLL